MGESSAPRRYRSAIPLTGGSIGAFGFFVIGISMVFSGLGQDIGETVIGVPVVALAGFLGFGVATTVTELTPAALTFRYNLRRKTIPWASVEAFRVARGRGTGLWWSLMVEVRGSEPVLVGSVVGTERYVRRVIDEMEEFRAAQLGPE
jgi:hypothetical protein